MTPTSSAQEGWLAGSKFVCTHNISSSQQPTGNIRSASSSTTTTTTTTITKCYQVQKMAWVWNEMLFFVLSTSFAAHAACFQPALGTLRPQRSAINDFTFTIWQGRSSSKPSKNERPARTKDLFNGHVCLGPQRQKMSDCLTLALFPF